MNYVFILISIMRIVTKRLRVKSRGFHYEVALYFSYLRIKFDDEINRNSFEFQTYFVISLYPKLYCPLSYAVPTVRVSF